MYQPLDTDEVTMITTCEKCQGAGQVVGADGTSVICETCAGHGREMVRVPYPALVEDIRRRLREGEQQSEG